MRCELFFLQSSLFTVDSLSFLVFSLFGKDGEKEERRKKKVEEERDTEKG